MRRGLDIAMALMASVGEVGKFAERRKSPPVPRGTSARAAFALIACPSEK